MTPWKNKLKYSENNLLEAVADVKTKSLSQREASKKYGVPQSTIADRLTGRYVAAILKPGKKCKLSNAQELRLTKFIKYRAKIGNGVTRPEISHIIKDILNAAENDGKSLTNEERLFKDNLPPKSWVHRYIMRQSDIALRTPEHLGHMRKRVSENQLRDWFKQLETFLLTEHNIEASKFLVDKNAHRIFNLDESGFPLNGGNKLKIISEKGCKNVYNVSTESKEQITVLGCVSADGHHQKPFVLFPGVRPKFDFKNVPM